MLPFERVEASRATADLVAHYRGQVTNVDPRATAFDPAKATAEPHAP